MQHFLKGIFGKRQAVSEDLDLQSGFADRAMNTLATSGHWEMNDEGRKFLAECMKLYEDSECGDEEFMQKLGELFDDYLEAVRDGHEKRSEIFMSSLRNAYVSWLEARYKELNIPFDPNDPSIQARMQGVSDSENAQYKNIVVKAIASMINGMRAKRIHDNKIAAHLGIMAQKFWISQEEIDKMVFSRN